MRLLQACVRAPRPGGGHVHELPAGCPVAQRPAAQPWRQPCRSESRIFAGTTSEWGGEVPKHPIACQDTQRCACARAPPDVRFSPKKKECVWTRDPIFTIRRKMMGTTRACSSSEGSLCPRGATPVAPGWRLSMLRDATACREAHYCRGLRRAAHCDRCPRGPPPR